MKNFRGLFIGIFILGLLISVSFASSAEIPGYSDKYLNDFAKLFTPDEVSLLRSLFYQTDINTTAEVVLVTAETCAPYTALDYSLQIGIKWKVGKADKDNGLVIAYCKAENKIGVSTGYGLEGILPDSKIGRLLDDYYVPLRDSNKTKEGIIAVSQQLVQVIEDNRAEVLSGQAGSSNSGSVDYIAIFFWIFIVYIILSKILGRVYKDKKKSNLPWFIPIFLPFPSRSSGGGISGGFGGGFGGGGFGGGGFGGGGAGR